MNSKSPSSRRNRPGRMRITLQHILVCIIASLGLLLVISYIVIFTTDKPSMRNSLLGHHSNVANLDNHVTLRKVTKTKPQEETTTEIKSPTVTVAYAISLTGCGDDSLVDGAAVLKHSIHVSSIHNPQSKSKYSYKMYAIVHPSAVDCSAQLPDYGYTLLVRDVPVAVQDIRGDFLRERVIKNGCCGEKEFIKLHAYTLISHPIVVHLDLDTLVLKPLDDVFDAMLHDDASELGHKARQRLPVFMTTPFPRQPHAFFTRDYNMHSNGKSLVQGGFLILRPSIDTFNEFRDIIKVGDYRSNGGWGGKGYAAYGAMTFQGIIPYFYDILQSGTAVELNRCIYNNMVDNPRDKPTVNDVVHGNCCDGRDDCEDCRSADLSTIHTAHFTLCQKPWECLPHGEDRIQARLCRTLHHEWFRIRKDLEDDLLANGRQLQSIATGDFQPDHFYGFCTKFGSQGYIHVENMKS